jgi:hypothetical protein
MPRRNTHTAIAVITTIAVLVSVAVLTLATAGTPSAQADECTGGGSPSPSPSASPSGGGGVNPTAILTLLPGGGSSSAGPSASPSRSASPSGAQTSSAEQQKREVVPVLFQDQTCKSTITIKYSGKKKAFGGRVGSENADCRRARDVTVKKVKKGNDATVGRTTTNARGVYTVPAPRARGRFYARVAKATVESGEQTTTCKSARSEVIER